MSAQNDTPGGATPALSSLEDIAWHLAAAFDGGDAAVIEQALAAVAAAPALPELAAAAGVPRSALIAGLTRGELSLEVTLAVMKVIDLHR